MLKNFLPHIIHKIQDGVNIWRCTKVSNKEQPLFLRINNSRKIWQPFCNVWDDLKLRKLNSISLYFRTDKSRSSLFNCLLLIVGNANCIEISNEVLQTLLKIISRLYALFSSPSSYMTLIQI